MFSKFKLSNPKNIDIWLSYGADFRLMCLYISIQLLATTQPCSANIKEFLQWTPGDLHLKIENERSLGWCVYCSLILGHFGGKMGVAKMQVPQKTPKSWPTGLIFWVICYLEIKLLAFSEQTPVLLLLLRLLIVYLSHKSNLLICTCFRVLLMYLFLHRKVDIRLEL